MTNGTFSGTVRYLLTADSSTGKLEKVEVLGESGELYEVNLSEFIAGLTGEISGSSTIQTISANKETSSEKGKKVSGEKMSPPPLQPKITCPFPRVLPNPPKPPSPVA